jgi:hypothetical protein
LMYNKLMYNKMYKILIFPVLPNLICIHIFLYAGFFKQQIFNVAFVNETHPYQHNYSEIITDIEKRFFVS